MHTSFLNISKDSSSLHKVIKEFTLSGGTRFGAACSGRQLSKPPTQSPAVLGACSLFCMRIAGTEIRNRPPCRFVASAFVQRKCQPFRGRRGSQASVGSLSSVGGTVTCQACDLTSPPERCRDVPRLSSTWTHSPWRPAVVLGHVLSQREESKEASVVLPSVPDKVQGAVFGNTI